MNVLSSAPPAMRDLSERSREIFRHIVDAYVESGEPVGSRTISRRLGMALSPATIRNVMADLEDAGLLYAPHTSAGRLPTELGLRLFVDGLLELGRLDRGRAPIHRGPMRRRRPQPAGGPGPGHRCAVRPLPLRRAGHGAEVGPGAAPYRIRPSGAGPGAGRHRHRRWAGGEPHHRRADGPARLLPHRGQQFPLGAPGRPHHRRSQACHRHGALGPARRARSSDPEGGGGRARQLDPPRAAPSSSAARLSFSTM